MTQDSVDPRRVLSRGEMMTFSAQLYDSLCPHSCIDHASCGHQTAELMLANTPSLSFGLLPWDRGWVATP